MTKTIKATCADCFWAALNTTYSDQRYCDLDMLPQALQDAIFKAENVDVECSSYTVGEHAAFLRGSVEIDGESFDFEVSLGSLENEDNRNEDGELVDSNGEPIEDEDEHFAARADEVFSCAEPAALSVYFRQA